MSATHTGLDELIRDMSVLPKTFMGKVEKVASKGALNIKQDWAQRWSGHSSIRHLPRAVRYDIETKQHTVTATIGPSLEKMQGPLGFIIEFGNTEYGSLRNAPIPGGQPALDEEEPKFVRALADLGEESLAGRSRVR